MAGKLEQAQRDLHGVIAAIATAVDEGGEPDCARSIALAGFLLANGCDGLNVLGTTGEATSFSLDQRRRVMNAYAESGLPLDRMMDWSRSSRPSCRQPPRGLFRFTSIIFRRNRDCRGTSLWSAGCCKISVTASSA